MNIIFFKPQKYDQWKFDKTCESTSSSLVVPSWVLMNKYHTVDKNPHCLCSCSYKKNVLYYSISYSISLYIETWARGPPIKTKMRWCCNAERLIRNITTNSHQYLYLFPFSIDILEIIDDSQLGLEGNRLLVERVRSCIVNRLLKLATSVPWMKLHLPVVAS